MAVQRDCQYCTKRFTTSVTKRLFCSDKCRLRYYRENALTCYYCGELADNKDHIFPQKYGNGKGDTVLACSDCNGRMNAAGPTSIDQRILKLIDSIERKYELHKPVPEWDDDEIDELGRSLKMRVKGMIQRRQKAIERVLHIKLRLAEIREATYKSEEDEY